MSSITPSELGSRQKTTPFTELFRRNIRQYGMVIALIAIVTFFQVMTIIRTDSSVLTPLNITNVILQNSYIVIIALGMLLVIVAGHIDLSVGSVAAVVGALAGVFIVNYDMNYFVAIVICLIAGALIGAMQGYFVAFLKIPAFIVTLAGMMIFRGLTFTFSGGVSVGPFPEGFQRISKGFIPDFFGAEGLHLTSLVIGIIISALIVYLSFRSRFNQRKYNFETEPLTFFVLKNVLTIAGIMYLCFLMASHKGLPNVLVLMSVLIVIYTFITTQTTIGRRIYALGGNEKATKLSGVKTERLVMLAFTNLGILAALGGLVFTARLNSATAKAGTNFELDAIAACFIGGASASGGVGTIIGVVIGAFVMGVMNNGMSMLGWEVDRQFMAKGIVLLLAVLFDVYNKNKA
jgi:putative multiple sugar transport system permease protein